MAQAMASMAGLSGSSQSILEGSLHLSSSSWLASPSGSSHIAVGGLGIKGQQAEVEATAQTSYRAALGLVSTRLVDGTLVKAVLADAKSIKLGPPPAPSGGLAGTLNADEARDVDLLLPPAEAATGAKESAKDILIVKESIDKKSWPYAMNNLLDLMCTTDFYEGKSMFIDWNS